MAQGLAKQNLSSTQNRKTNDDHRNDCLGKKKNKTKQRKQKLDWTI